jgi:hypothetical protein
MHSECNPVLQKGPNLEKRHGAFGVHLFYWQYVSWKERGGEVALWEESWLNSSAPDCKSVVLGSNPAPPQHTANSVSPEVGSHLG